MMNQQIFYLILIIYHISAADSGGFVPAANKSTTIPTIKPAQNSTTQFDKLKDKPDKILLDTLADSHQQQAQGSPQTLVNPADQTFQNVTGQQLMEAAGTNKTQTPKQSASQPGYNPQLPSDNAPAVRPGRKKPKKPQGIVPTQAETSSSVSDSHQNPTPTPDSQIMHTESITPSSDAPEILTPAIQSDREDVQPRPSDSSPQGQYHALPSQSNETQLKSPSQANNNSQVTQQQAEQAHLPASASGPAAPQLQRASQPRVNSVVNPPEDFAVKPIVLPPGSPQQQATVYDSSTDQDKNPPIILSAEDVNSSSNVLTVSVLLTIVSIINLMIV